MRNRVLVVALFLAGAAVPRAGLAAQITTDLPSGQPLGTTITVSTDATGASDTRYRLGVTRVGDDPRVVYDYQASNTFAWTPFVEGAYLLSIDVRSGGPSGSVQTLTALYAVAARTPLAWIVPVVTATPHPLVAVYSAPPCAPQAAFMRVLFASTDSPITQHITNAKPCTGDRTMNFYIGGMRAHHLYFMLHELLDASGQHLAFGDLRWFQTGAAPASLPPTITAAVAGAPSVESIVLESPVLGNPSQNIQPFTYAVDLEGQLVWYNDRIDTVPRLAGDGLFTQLTSESGIRTGVRLFDLVGNTVRATTVERINEQLTAIGLDTINDVHHEGRLLPDGRLVVLGSIEKVLSDLQGTGPVDILGDGVYVLDENFQVVWAWSEFDRLPVARKALLGETCQGMQTGCSPVNLQSTANDWTHTNAVTYDPSDGNLIVSIRHQDWLVKIDYRNGAGNGDILWTLGAGGDFTLDTDDPTAWFSHAHDPNLTPAHMLMMYDNGNTRCSSAADPTRCHSRGQVYALDEPNRRAQLVLNADLGEFSFALGSAQALANGDYYFASGALTTSNGNASHASEVTPSGSTVFSLAAASFVYRSHRLFNLYLTPPEWNTTNTLTLLEFLSGQP